MYAFRKAKSDTYLNNTIWLTDLYKVGLCFLSGRSSVFLNLCYLKSLQPTWTRRTSGLWLGTFRVVNFVFPAVINVVSFTAHPTCLTPTCILHAQNVPPCNLVTQSAEGGRNILRNADTCLPKYKYPQSRTLIMTFVRHNHYKTDKTQHGMDSAGCIIKYKSHDYHTLFRSRREIFFYKPNCHAPSRPKSFICAAHENVTKLKYNEICKLFLYSQ
jgi:hypothetical protein